MQTNVGIATPSTSFQPLATAPTDAPVTHALSHYQIIRRNGAVVPFEPAKIAVAMMKAFLAVHGTQGAASASVRETVEELTQYMSPHQRYASWWVQSLLWHGYSKEMIAHTKKSDWPNNQIRKRTKSFMDRYFAMVLGEDPTLQF